MDLVSSAPPVMPAISPVVFGDGPTPQASTLPGNFWALLFAAPAEPEISTEVATAPSTSNKAASPQEIATALIRSMLAPVAQPAPQDPDVMPPQENAEVEVTEVPGLNLAVCGAAVPVDRDVEKLPLQENADEKLKEPDSTVLAVTAPAVPLETTAPNSRAEQRFARPEIPTRGSAQSPSRLAGVEAVSKILPATRVAFELRLTPIADEAAAPPAQSDMKNEPPVHPNAAAVHASLRELPAAEPAQTSQETFKEADPKETSVPPKGTDIQEPLRIKRSEATTFEQRSPETPAPQVPLATAKPHPVADVPFIIAAPQPKVGLQAKISVPEALAAPAPVELPAKPGPASTPVQEIAMRVSAPDSQPIDLRVTERGGQVHVTVRTADAGVRTSLQGDLGSLVGKLEQSGFRTEALVPEAPVHALTTHSTVDLGGSGAYGDSQDPRNESDGRWAGSDSRNPDQRQQNQQHRRHTRAWEEMMEDMQ